MHIDAPKVYQCKDYHFTGHKFVIKEGQQITPIACLNLKSKNQLVDGKCPIPVTKLTLTGQI